MTALHSHKMQITILYEDDSLIAVNKPSGLLVHKSFIAKDATEFALQLVRDMVGHYVYPVHRLDRPTSGVFVICKIPEIARLLSLQFDAHEIRKSLLCGSARLFYGASDIRLSS